MYGRKLIVAACFIGIGTLAFGRSFISGGEVVPRKAFYSDPRSNITPKTFPDGVYGSVYKNQQLKVTGGGGETFTFSVSAGSLPPGMLLSGDGNLSGTPTAAGAFPFTVVAVGKPGSGNGDRGSRSASQIYTLIVSHAVLTVSANAQTKEYGTPDPVLSFSSQGFVNGDGAGIFTGKLSRQPGEAVGKYAITKGNLGAGPNYTIGFTGNTFTISPASQEKNPKISPGSIPAGQYGTTYNTQKLKVTGGDGSYTFSLSKGSLPAGMSLASDGTISGTPSDAGSFPFTVTASAQSGSSNPVSQDYNLTIDQASLTITVSNVTITYGGALPALAATYSGFVNGDNSSSLTSPPNLATSATSGSPAGTYPVTASGAVDSNYRIAYNPGTLTINPAALAVVANPQAKDYGTADPPLTYAATGFVNGDNTGVFTGALSRAAGENVGKYAISLGSLSAGHNYTISYTGNYLTISAVSIQQHITWTQSLLFGCNSSMQMQLTATASSGLPVIYSVADTSIATVSGNILTILRPGSTVITASQPGDVNHTAAAPVTDTLLYQSTSLIRQHWSDVIFFDNSSGSFVQWQWYKNGQAIPGATGPYYSETPSLNGQYYVIATNAASQQIQTCTLTITGDSVAAGGISVQPNPGHVGANVTVVCRYAASALQGAILQIIDITGRVRQQVSPVAPSMQVTMPSDPGIYIINLILANGQKASVNALLN
jgi:hypothetical protein